MIELSSKNPAACGGVFYLLWWNYTVHTLVFWFVNDIRQEVIAFFYDRPEIRDKYR
jgi:hypothetical protein